MPHDILDKEIKACKILHNILNPLLLQQRKNAVY